MPLHSPPWLVQADIFSLGVILFELFLRKTLAAQIMEMDNNPDQIEMFAYKVRESQDSVDMTLLLLKSACT